MLTAAVISGLILLFMQFRAAPIQEYILSHTAENDMRYWEWDIDGQRHELTAVFGGDGYLLEITGSDFLDAAREPAADYPLYEGAVGAHPELPAVTFLSSHLTMENADDAERAGNDQNSVKHRIGFSCVLKASVDDAVLKLQSTGDTSYLIFLEDEVLYSDFPGEAASLDRLPEGIGGIYRLYDADRARSISVTLPQEYVGKTFTVVEYITVEQAAGWYPIVPVISSPESDLIIYAAANGPKNIVGGMMAAVLITLTMLFIWKLKNGERAFADILLTIFVLIQMIAITNHMSMHSSMPVLRLNELIDAFARYCAADFLLIFIALKIRRPASFILLGASSLHAVFSLAQLIRYYILGEFLHLSSRGLAVFSTVIFIFGIALVIWESRKKRSLRNGLWCMFVLAAGYAALTLLFRFADYITYRELINPILAVKSLNFYPVNELLSFLVMIMVTVINISRYISGQVEYRVRLNSLDRLNHMKTELMTTISHEARTPLAVLASYSGLVAMELRDKGVDAQTASDLDKIAFEAKRVAGLIDGMNRLTLPDTDAEKRMSIDLSEIILQTARLYRHIMERCGVELSIDIAENLPPVLGNPEELTQVPFNLLQNAKNHTFSGSVTVKARRDGDQITVSVEDTGTGVSPELLPRVFERGVHGDGNGTGLGLAICKEIIEAHNGTIRMESELNKGTAVTFILPVYKGDMSYGE